MSISRVKGLINTIVMTHLNSPQSVSILVQQHGVISQNEKIPNFWEAQKKTAWKFEKALRSVGAAT
jgi:predicted RNA-binding protein associated with RNAse of E/G family